MTINRTGVSGGARAQQVVPAAPAPAPKTAQAPAPKAQQVVPQRVRTQDDRHGAASRAFDDPSAAALKAKVGSSTRDGIGFGRNDGDRPLRSAPGSPTFSAWSNPGSVISQLTCHPPVGKIAEWESLMRTGSACVLAGAIMHSSPVVVALLRSVAESTAATLLTPEHRQELQDLLAKVRGGDIAYAGLVRAMTLMARGASCSQPLADLVRTASRPPAMNFLDKESLKQLKVYDRLLQQQAELDEEQAARISQILSTALNRPVPVVRTWDPDGSKDTRVLRARVYPPGEDGAPLREDDVGLLVRIAGVGKGKQKRITLPPAGEPVQVLQDALLKLEAHQGAIVRVHKTDSPDDKEANRYIMVGRRGDGMAYLYNPDPRRGDYTLVFGRVGKNQSAEFNAQLQRYNERLRPDVDNDAPTLTYVKHKA